MQFNVHPNSINDNGRWHRMYAILPMRVEGSYVWGEYVYWRLIPQIDYNAQMSKDMNSGQWGYRRTQEWRLEKNMTEEDIRNAY